MINVTKTYLPPMSSYQRYLEEIFNSGQITNNGKLVQKLEKRLSEFLGVKNIVLVSNGTVALEIAYRALGLTGSVITTPFSFVATTSSLVTNNIEPIFSDIDELTLNIDHNLIEDKVTENTTAIVAVHVFGNACEIEEIEEVARKHKLKVIYDAAHAFGVKYKGKSILNFGNISTISFHATKIFHTIEGGALIINDDSLVEKVRYLINFGIKDSDSIPSIGINAKMNEFEAAMGLCVLDDIDSIFIKRKKIANIYYKELSQCVKFQKRNINSLDNYSYVPIILKDEMELLKIQKILINNNINPRRYFYPSLDSLDYIQGDQFCKISRDISSRILCLPIYSDLDVGDIYKIVKIIKDNI
jgi:dTDP-4-amino-4,6-dideoxygalactose transaminase